MKNLHSTLVLLKAYADTPKGLLVSNLHSTLVLLKVLKGTKEKGCQWIYILL